MFKIRYHLNVFCSCWISAILNNLDVLLSLACVLSAKRGGREEGGGGGGREETREKETGEGKKRRDFLEGRRRFLSLQPPPPSLPFNSHPFLRAVTVFAQENCCKSGMKSQKLSTSEQPFSCRVLRVIQTGQRFALFDDTRRILPFDSVFLPLAV